MERAALQRRSSRNGEEAQELRGARSHPTSKKNLSPHPTHTYTHTQIQPHTHKHPTSQSPPHLHVSEPNMGPDKEEGKGGWRENRRSLSSELEFGGGEGSSPRARFQVTAWSPALGALSPQFRGTGPVNDESLENSQIRVFSGSDHEPNIVRGDLERTGAVEGQGTQGWAGVGIPIETSSGSQVHGSTPMHTGMNLGSIGDGGRGDGGRGYFGGVGGDMVAGSGGGRDWQMRGCASDTSSPNMTPILRASIVRCLVYL